MLISRTTLTRRIVAALDQSPARIAVLVGGCGSGRTTVLQQLRDRLGPTAAQSIDVERTATTPERFLRAVVAASPFPFGEGSSSGPRAAFEAALAFFTRARTEAGEPATFLLDEFLELRTFESFPGLRRVLRELVDSLAGGGNRFVLTSRYVARTLRLLRDQAARYEVIHMPPLTAEDTLQMLGPAFSDPREGDAVARTVHLLGDGRPVYVRALVDELAAMREAGGAGGADPIGALAALFAPGAPLSKQCGFSYELRLHRARGYGALKAILDILAEQERLTLTEISQRLQRTPGSTKDYLSWLEDVDLITAQHKRYSFSDPLVSMWVRLYCHASAPSEDDVTREVHRYALPRLPQPQAPPQEPALAMAAAGSAPSGDERKEWGIIEID